jgi:hypothetical protein
MIDLVILFGAFFCGAAVALLLLLRVACHQEGRTLRAEPPGTAAAVARRMTGLYMRTPAIQAWAGPEGP